MQAIRFLIASRRTHRYANTLFWRKLNALLTALFDAFDSFTVIRSRADNLSGHRALDLFKRIVHRHVADLKVCDEAAFSDNFSETLLRISSIWALKKLYPLANNIYDLRYFDFLFLQIAECQQDKFGDRPFVEITWNERDLFDEVCRLQNSCVILSLHNGFLHGTRALSYFKKDLAAVAHFPDDLLEFYKLSEVKHPEAIEFIPVNRDTLLTLTKVAKRDKTIICAPDVFNQKTRRYDLITMGMFQFAKYANVPLYLFDFCIDDDCKLRGFIKGPIDCRQGSVKAAEEFISFCRSVSGRTLTIINKGWSRIDRESIACN
jgi:hypothetical protein